MRQFFHELLFAPSRWALVTFFKRTVWLLMAYLLGLGAYAAAWAVAHAQGVPGTGTGLAILSASMGLVGLYVAITTNPGDRIRVSRERRPTPSDHDADMERVDPTFLAVPVRSHDQSEPAVDQARDEFEVPASDDQRRQAA